MNLPRHSGNLDSRPEWRPLFTERAAYNGSLLEINMGVSYAPFLEVLATLIDFGGPGMFSFKTWLYGVKLEVKLYLWPQRRVI